jgi:hypothetical protein
MNHLDTPIQPISTVPLKVSESEKIKVMREIEAKTEKMVIHALKTGTLPDWIHHRHNNNDSDDNSNNKNNESSITEIQNIMHSGADEFKEKVGRNITYAEMRAMYG